MKLTLFNIGAFAFATAQSLFALTTAEIVAKVKPSVVYIRVWNSADPKHFSEGTGFFVANDLIVTDSHVVNAEGKIQVDQIAVTDLAGNAIDVKPTASYDNSDRNVDLLLLDVVAPVNHSFLNLSNIAPVEGQSVTVLGNPNGFTGTVSTGIVSALREG